MDDNFALFSSSLQFIRQIRTLKKLTVTNTETSTMTTPSGIIQEHSTLTNKFIHKR